MAEKKDTNPVEVEMTQSMVYGNHEKGHSTLNAGSVVTVPKHVADSWTEAGVAKRVKKTQDNK